MAKFERVVSPIAQSNQFKSLITTGNTWSYIVRKHLIENTSNEDSLKTMQDLVQHRDILDHVAFDFITKQLFDVLCFTTIVDSTGVKENPNDESAGYKYRYYKMKIYRGGSTGTNLEALRNKKHCEIVIKAPGSRTLTSDVDTSIQVKGAENLNLGSDDKEEYLKKYAKEFKLLRKDDLTYNAKYLDFNGIIENELIRLFGEYSRMNFKSTNGMNRDSNIYAAGSFLSEESDEFHYPKFSMNIILLSRFPVADLHSSLKEKLKSHFGKTFFGRFKLVKHQYELAASLFLLRQALNKRFEWEEFHNLVLGQFEENENKQILENGYSRIITDIETIFEICEKLYFYQSTTVDNYLNLPKIRDYASYSCYSKCKDTTLLDADLRNYALEELYVKHLTVLTQINSLVKQKHDQIREQIESLNNTTIKIDENIDLAHYTTLQKEQLGQLTKLATDLCELENRRQFQEVLASLFASEAYTNRSAPYHIVKGMQGGSKVKITKQTLLGSSLQQIGFRLLHSEAQRREGRSEEEILYKNAKYGHRVASLLFSLNDTHPPYTTDKIRSIWTRYPKLQLLKILDFSPVSTTAIFNEQEILLLNYETKIVTTLKGMSGTSVGKQLKFVQTCLRERNTEINMHDSEQEEKLFKMIAAKLFVSCFIAKKLKKGGIWGFQDFSEQEDIYTQTISQVQNYLTDTRNGLPNLHYISTQTQEETHFDQTSEGHTYSQTLPHGEFKLILDPTPAQSTYTTVETSHGSGYQSNNNFSQTIETKEFVNNNHKNSNKNSVVESNIKQITTAHNHHGSKNFAFDFSSKSSNRTPNPSKFVLESTKLMDKFVQHEWDSSDFNNLEEDLCYLIGGPQEFAYCFQQEFHGSQTSAAEFCAHYHEVESLEHAKLVKDLGNELKSMLSQLPDSYTLLDILSATGTSFIPIQILNSFGSDLQIKTQLKKLSKYVSWSKRPGKLAVRIPYPYQKAIQLIRSNNKLKLGVNKYLINELVNNFNFPFIESQSKTKVTSLDSAKELCNAVETVLNKCNSSLQDFTSEMFNGGEIFNILKLSLYLGRYLYAESNRLISNKAKNVLFQDQAQRCKAKAARFFQMAGNLFARSYGETAWYRWASAVPFSDQKPNLDLENSEITKVLRLFTQDYLNQTGKSESLPCKDHTVEEVTLEKLERSWRIQNQIYLCQEARKEPYISAYEIGVCVQNYCRARIKNEDRKNPSKQFLECEEIQKSLVNNMNSTQRIRFRLDETIRQKERNSKKLDNSNEFLELVQPLYDSIKDNSGAIIAYTSSIGIGLEDPKFCHDIADVFYYLGFLHSDKLRLQKEKGVSLPTKEQLVETITYFYQSLCVMQNHEDLHQFESKCFFRLSELCNEFIIPFSVLYMYRTVQLQGEGKHAEETNQLQLKVITSFLNYCHDQDEIQNKLEQMKSLIGEMLQLESQLLFSAFKKLNLTQNSRLIEVTEDFLRRIQELIRKNCQITYDSEYESE